MPIKDWSKYPSNWKEIRQRILERAENKCECCGLHNHDTVISYKENGVTFWETDQRKDFPINFKIVLVVLTIAHLDHDEENRKVKDERLKAMCQLCHLRYDVQEKKRRKALKK